MGDDHGYGCGYDFLPSLLRKKVHPNSCFSHPPPFLFVHDGSVARVEIPKERIKIRLQNLLS
jgi:hypothetical protein